jgi:enoyl-CoA hydratase/carnithine racemase
MILTCEPINAETAEKWGLAARVFPEDQLLDRAVEMAAKIASFSKPIGSHSCSLSAGTPELRDSICSCDGQGVRQ